MDAITTSPPTVRIKKRALISFVVEKFGKKPEATAVP